MTRELRFSGFLLLIAGLALWRAMGLSRLAQLAPMWVLVPTVSLLSVQILVDGWPHLAKGLPVLGRYTRSVVPDRLTVLRGRGSSPIGLEQRRQREVRGLGWIGALASLIYIFGFLPAVPILLLSYLRAEAGLRWAESLMITGGIVITIYLLFGVLVPIPLPEGLFW